jgi:hypothetical protein
MDADELREALRASGDRRAQAMHDARLGSEARKLVIAARAQGVTVKDIAADLRVTPRAIHYLLAEQGDATE